MLKVEMFPEVNAEGKVIGKMSRKEAHSGSKKLHPVVHLHIINDGCIYLQKRSENKDIQPGKWDTAVGGHVDYGEDIDTALKREAFEELGIKDFSYKFIVKYLWESDVEHELVFSHVTRDTVNIVPNPAEISEGRFWSFDEIEANLGEGVFTKNFESEFLFLNKTIIPVYKQFEM